jgi:hypothetical protein
MDLPLPFLGGSNTGPFLVSESVRLTCSVPVTPGKDVTIAVAIDGGGHRRSVIADWEEGRRRGVQGSPHAFLPDGTGVFNPGIGKIDWVRGIPVPRQVDEGAIAKLLEQATTG